MKIKDLVPNKKNPRKISDDKLTQLKRAMIEFGDLSGIVYNRKTKRLVGGHQRTKHLDPEAEIVIKASWPKPTKVGTMAVGHVLLGGERFSYREVMWSENKEKAANIAANKNAGEWDMPQLKEWVEELDSDEFDMELTMFDIDEVEELLEASEPKKRDKKQTPQKKFVFIKCPNCEEVFEEGRFKVAKTPQSLRKAGKQPISSHAKDS